MWFKPRSLSAALLAIPSLTLRSTNLFPTCFQCAQRADVGLLVQPVWIDPAVQYNQLASVEGCWLAGIAHGILTDKL